MSWLSKVFVHSLYAAWDNPLHFCTSALNFSSFGLIMVGYSVRLALAKQSSLSKLPPLEAVQSVCLMNLFLK